MADLYVNGLFWKRMSHPENGNFVPMFLQTSVDPVVSAIEEACPSSQSITVSTVRFIRLDIHDNGEHKVIYNLDDPNVYVDLLTKDLKTRDIENYEGYYIQQKQRTEILESPIESRFDILDL
jgi:hypothetical protein